MSTVAAIVKKEKTMEFANPNGNEKKRKRLREATYKEVEDALYTWFLNVNNPPNELPRQQVLPRHWATWGLSRTLFLQGDYLRSTPTTWTACKIVVRTTVQKQATITSSLQ